MRRTQADSLMIVPTHDMRTNSIVKFFLMKQLRFVGSESEILLKFEEGISIKVFTS
jgi:hypothetical protein